MKKEKVVATLAMGVVAGGVAVGGTSTVHAETSSLLKYGDTINCILPPFLTIPDKPLDNSIKAVDEKKPTDL